MCRAGVGRTAADSHADRLYDRNIAAFKRFFPLRAGFNQELPVAVVVRQVETGVKKQRAPAYGGRIELGIEVDEGRQTAVVG